MCNCFSKNLGLGEGSALPVGVPIPWPSATPPTGWLKCNGAAFTASQYPKLSQVYPLLRLPDLRGEFIRGWDDGRGVDSNRSLLSNQGDDYKSHRHDLRTYGGNSVGTGGSVFSVPGVKDGSGNNLIVNGGRGFGNVPMQILTGGNGDIYLASNGVESAGGSETRPRNIAFNYIVRAA